MYRFGLATAAAALLCATQSLAFDTGHHRDATLRALDYHGFEETPIQIATVTNWYVDYYSETAGTSSAVRAAKAACENLHFDNIFSTAYVEKTWRQFMVNAHTMIDSIMDNTALNNTDRRVQLITTVGMTLHAIQDFYTHSNWATFYPKPDVGYNTNTYLSVGIPAAASSSNPLQTGFYPNDRTDVPATAIAHGSYTFGENKDSHVRPHWDEAYVFSYVETLRFLKLAESWVNAKNSGYWDTLKTLDKDDIGSINHTAMEIDAVAATTISMLVKGTGDNNGHYKGDLSGDTDDFAVASVAFTGHPDSFIVDVVKNVRPQETLAYCLYDANCAMPTQTYTQTYLPNQQALHLRVTDIKALSSGIDVGSPDFYPRITMGGVTFLDRILMDMSDYDDSDHTLDGVKLDAWWQIHFAAIDNNPSTSFKIKVYDYDTGLGGNDDHIDISGDGDNIDGVFTYATSAMSGDVSGVHTTAETKVTSEGGNGDRAQIKFYMYAEPLLHP